MTFVTDTHPFVHHVMGRRKRLGRRALGVFDSVKRGRETLIVPFTLLEEVMLLCEIGRIRLPLPFRDLVITIRQAENFDWGVNDCDLLLEAATFTTIPTSRIRGLKSVKWLKNKHVRCQGLHYRAAAEGACGVVIFGDGCAGSSSLSLSSNNCSSGSGWVVRVRISSRPSVVGKCTSIICIAANFSRALRGVSPGASERNLSVRVMCRQ